MPKTISKRTINGTGKPTSKRRFKVIGLKKTGVLSLHKKVQAHASNVYSEANDPMVPLLKSSGFREMTDAEYAKVKPFLKPWKKK